MTPATNALFDDDRIAQTCLNFQSICEHYSTRIFQHCFSITKEYESAQDYTQDILLKLFSHLHRFRGTAHIGTWIYSITRNHCLDQLRLAKRLPLERLSTDQDGLTADVSSEDFDELAGEQAWQTLSGGTQQLLRLKYEQGVRIATLARELNASESAVKMRLMRARHQLQLAYQDYKSREEDE